MVRHLWIKCLSVRENMPEISPMKSVRSIFWTVSSENGSKERVNKQKGGGTSADTLACYQLPTNDDWKGLLMFRVTHSACALKQGDTTHIEVQSISSKKLFVLKVDVEDFQNFPPLSTKNRSFSRKKIFPFLFYKVGALISSAYSGIECLKLLVLLIMFDLFYYFCN